MQLWDDLVRSGSKVVVMGSTNRSTHSTLFQHSSSPINNRPQDLDAAIQRRFERSFLLGLPDLAARADIFRRTLTGCSLHPSLKDFDFQRCAALTEGYSSSDLRAVCKAALQLCEFSDDAAKEEDNVNKGVPRISEGMGRLRPLTIDVSEDTQVITTTCCGFILLFVEQVVELAVKSFYPTTWAANSFESLSGVPLFRSPASPSSDGVGAEIAPRWDWTQRTSSSKPFDTAGNSSNNREDFEDEDDDDDDDEENDDEGGDCVK